MAAGSTTPGDLPLNWLDSLRRRLTLVNVSDWSFSPRGEPSGQPLRARFVIAPQSIPTVDYYVGALDSHLPQRTAFDAELARYSRGEREPLQLGTQVVLVRMPASKWAEWLDEQRNAVAEVVWLIDDDVLAARDDRDLPHDYRLKLLSDYLRFKRVFEPRVSKIWASTSIVARRYPPNKVEVRPPKPLARSARRPNWITVFYHGTAAHVAEHRFLSQVFVELQRRCDRTLIEVCGDSQLRKIYRGVPRLRMVHPVPWPAYLAFLESGRYDIGLVPLLDTPFNAGRSGIKALELQSLGIPGVLSSRVPYDASSGAPKMLRAGDDSREWVESILQIVNDPNLLHAGLVLEA